MAFRLATVLLWMEHRLAGLRRKLTRPVQQTTARRELFDRRDLRARW